MQARRGARAPAAAEALRGCRRRYSWKAAAPSSTITGHLGGEAQVVVDVSVGDEEHVGAELLGRREDRVPRIEDERARHDLARRLRLPPAIRA